MKRAFVTLLVVGLTVSACSTMRESRVTPRNWFSASQEAPTLGETSSIVDNRPLVPRVSNLSIDRTSSGAIVRAEALMPSAGWWDAELIPENHGRPVDGVLTFRFVAAAPREPVPGTSEAARTIVAVHPVSAALMEVVGSIVVTGGENSRRSRR